MNKKHLLLILTAIIQYLSILDNVSASETKILLSKMEQVSTSSAIFDISTSEIGSNIKKVYSENLTDEKRSAVLAREAVDELNDVFEAAYLVNFYTGERLYSNHMRDAYNALERISKLNKKNVTEMYHAYIVSEDFNKAKELRIEKSIDVEPPPSVKNGRNTINSELAWSIDFDNNTIEQFEMPLEKKGLRIYALVSPRCHFAQNAVTAIEKNKELSELLRGRLSLIMRIDQNFSMKDLKEWNRQHPEYPITILSGIKNWQIFNEWSTPTFYILKDGKLKEKIEGWPAGGNEKKLISSINDINGK